MSQNNFEEVTLPAGRYCNSEELQGYQEKDPLYQAKPLYPLLPQNQDLIPETILNLESLQKTYPSITAGHINFQLPHDRTKQLTSEDYPTEPEAQSLQSTLLTYTLIPKNRLINTQLTYTIKQDIIPPLEDIIPNYQTPAIFSNFGFFTTPQLIYADIPKSTPWAHNARYPKEFHITFPNLSPYLGFYYDQTKSGLSSTFQDAKRGLLAIDQSDQPRIIPQLEIQSYDVQFPNGSKHTITAHNDLNSQADITLYTPDIQTPQMAQLQTQSEKTYCTTDDIQTYSEIITNHKINLFITNIGDGQTPQDHIIQIWEDAFPITTFGAIIAIDKAYFQKHFTSLEEFHKTQLHKPIHVIPKSTTDLTKFRQIYAASIPLISDGHNHLLNKDLNQIMEYYRTTGNFTSPNLQLALESKNFSPIIREPSNMIIETENYIGNLLFNGRYELSLGSCSLDQTYILDHLNTILAEPIQHALLLDGGSGSKCVYVDSKQKLHPLNIPAAGFRNPLGDPSGNYYSGLVFNL